MKVKYDYNHFKNLLCSYGSISSFDFDYETGHIYMVRKRGDRYNLTDKHFLLKNGTNIESMLNIIKYKHTYLTGYRLNKIRVFLKDSKLLSNWFSINIHRIID